MVVLAEHIQMLKHMLLAAVDILVVVVQTLVPAAVDQDMRAQVSVMRF
jgi:hypothetical protein